MFFILERKVENKRFKQLSVVVADSVEAAAAKVGMEILSDARPPDAPVIWAWLLGEYYLEEMSEITSPASIPDHPARHIQQTSDALKRVDAIGDELEEVNRSIQSSTE